MSFDQFLLNLHTDYSGSYTDDLVYSNKFLKQNPNVGVGLPSNGKETARWTFDENINDQSGNSHNLELLTGSLQYVTGPRSTVKAILFDGETVLTKSSNNELFHMWSSSSTDITRSMSIEVLIKPSSSMFNYGVLDPYVSGAKTQKLMRNGLICMASPSQNEYDPKKSKHAFCWILSGDELPGIRGYLTSSFITELGYRENKFQVVHSASISPYYEANVQDKSEDDDLDKASSGSLPQGYLPDVWQYLAITYQETSSSVGNHYSTTKYYINGELLRTHVHENKNMIFNYNISNDRQNSIFWVGGSYSGSQPTPTPGAGTGSVPRILDRFVGEMSDLTFYNSKVLSDEEIANRYINAFSTTFKSGLYLGSKTDTKQKYIKNLTINNEHQFKSNSMFPYYNNNRNSKNSGFVKFKSNEVIWDSLTPSPVDYHIQNGGQLLLGEGNLRPLNQFNSPNFKSNTYFSLPILGVNKPDIFITGSPGPGSRSNGIVSGSENLTIGDASWSSFFPFEKKYKNLQKLSKPSYFLNNEYTVKLGDSGSLLPIPWSGWVSGDGDARSDSDGVLNSHVKSSIFSGIISFASEIISAGVFSFNQVLSTPLPEEQLKPIFFTTTLADTSFSDIELIFSGNINSANPYYTYSRKPDGVVGVPSLSETYKFYFGTGRKGENGAVLPYTDNVIDNTITPLISSSGYNINETIEAAKIAGNAISKVPGFYGSLPAQVFHSPYRSYGLGVKISGWRYGLYSALPSNTNVIFRRDKYGQLRDMLEQRLLTRISKNVQGISTEKLGAVLGAVEVRFVQGTDSYVTSSNSSLNTTDSGIYTRFYTSGKPYSDSRD